MKKREGELSCRVRGIMKVEELKFDAAKRSYVAAAFTALLLAGCAGGYSLREQIIRNQLPRDYRGYTNGIVASPTEADIQAAIALGRASKDGNTLEYAYLTKAPRGVFASDDVYVRVATPLYLIADHAREQARDYRKVDDSFVQYARSLGAVRISISQQYINTDTLDAYAFQRQVVLLRDGLRVDPLRDIQAWAGQNPFADKSSKQVQAAISKVRQTAAQYSTGFATQAASASGGRIVLGDFDAVFPIEELSKPGRYELAFRTPPTASLLAPGDQEVRFPISFSTFR